MGTGPAGRVIFYRRGHDSSFGILVLNNEIPYVYFLFGVLRKPRTGIYCRFGQFSREIHWNASKKAPFSEIQFS